MRERKPASARLGTVAASAAAWFGYLFMVLPSLIVIPMSFGDKNEFQFPPHTISLYLYRKYFGDPSWMSATGESLIVAAGATIVALLIGISAAYGLARSDFPGKKAVVVFLLSPLFVPSIVIALGLYIYFGQLHIVGTTEGLILAHALITIPFVIVTVSSGLRQVDPVLERAAHIMGASRLEAVVKVTLPLIRPSIIAAALFAFLISFDEVVIAYFLTGVRTQTLPVKMYSSIHWEISPVLAAIATLLTALSLFVCLVGAFAQPREHQ